MSSMRKIAFVIPLVIGSATLAQLAQTNVQAPGAAAAATNAAYDINYSLADWRRLRAAEGYRFADYARFLITNPGWPEEAKMRRWAEKAMAPGENPVTVVSFFRSQSPKTGNGWARLA